jgi:hypothetical protein
MLYINMAVLAVVLTGVKWGRLTETRAAILKLGVANI